MNEFNNIKLFTTKTGNTVSYEDMLRDVYENTEDTRTDIKLLVKKLSEMVDDPTTAITLMTHVTEMLNCRIKNDDLLVKVLAIIGRTQKPKSNDGNSPWEITAEERMQLLEAAKEMVIVTEETK